MNEFLKYTNPSWHEVLTEQESRIKLSCSGNTRSNSKKQTWETDDQFNRRMFFYEYQNNEKIIKAYRRILKYGHPNKCPIINQINNLILFV